VAAPVEGSNRVDEVGVEELLLAKSTSKLFVLHQRHIFWAIYSEPEAAPTTGLLRTKIAHAQLTKIHFWPLTKGMKSGNERLSSPPSVAVACGVHQLVLMVS